MTHPHKREHKTTEKRSIERLDLPEAGALSGEGRLQKMQLHDASNPPLDRDLMATDSGPNPSGPTDQAEGEQE